MKLTERQREALRVLRQNGPMQADRENVTVVALLAKGLIEQLPGGAMALTVAGRAQAR